MLKHSRFEVQYNLVEEQLLNEDELELLRMHLQANHQPDYEGDSGRGFGDIYDLGRVAAGLKDMTRDEDIIVVYPEAAPIIARLCNEVQFIEVPHAL